MSAKASKRRSLFALITGCCVVLALAVGLSVANGPGGGFACGAASVVAQRSAGSAADKSDAADKNDNKDKSADKDDASGTKASGDKAQKSASDDATATSKPAASGSSADEPAAADASEPGVGSSSDDEVIPGVSVDDASDASDADQRAGDAGTSSDDEPNGTGTAQPSGPTAVELVDEPIFTIPDGAEYVPGEVLISVDEGMNSVELANRLAEQGVRTVDAGSAFWVTDDLVRLNVVQGSTVEEAVNELLVTGVARDAQPDYVFSMEESTAPRQGALWAMQDQGVAADSTDATNADAVALEEDTPAEDDAATVDATSAEPSDSAPTGTDADVKATSGDASERAEPELVDIDEALNGADEAADASEVADEDEALVLVDDDEASDDAVDADQDGMELVDDEGLSVEADATDDATADEEAAATVTTQAAAAASNDPYLVFQWGLQSINAPDVWAQEKTTNMQKVGVAVIDCGLDVNHRDLKNMIAPDSAYNAYRAIQGVTDASELADVAPGAGTMAGVGRYDHGTHVTGIIAAQRNNLYGTAGVSDNAQIIPIRVYDYDPDNPKVDVASAVKGIDYAIKNQDKYNIRVINMSLGAKVSSISPNDVLGKKITEAFNKGIITVCSAGNEGATRGSYINYPSDWATAVSVINLSNDTYQISTKNFSGYDSFVSATCKDPYSVVKFYTSNYNASGETSKNISAPGSDILSTSDYSQNLFGATKPAWMYYMFDTGTSMSAPHVSGVLALMFGKTTVPKTAAGAQQMIDALYGSARHVDNPNATFEANYGHGEVDASSAWDALEQPYMDGSAYVKVGQSGVVYSIKSSKSSANIITNGWSFSSSNANVLQVDAATGAATVKKAGTATITATKSGQKLTKTVTAYGPISGYSVVMTGSSTKYTIAQPSAMSWTWNVKGGDATITDSGVLTVKSTVAKLTLSATAVVNKNTNERMTLTKTVYVVGALTGGGTIKAGNTKTLSLGVPDSMALSNSALVWGSNDETIATVKGGVVTGKLMGTTTIWVAPKEAVSTDSSGKKTVASGSYRSVKITVTDTLAGAGVKVAAIANKTYTGSAIKPKPVLKYGGATLKLNTDYTISAYANNTKVGTATITLTGKGRFAGSTRKVTFKIVKAKISSAKVATIAKHAYTGKAIKPKPKLTFASKTLKLNTDYTLTYKNNKKAGTGTVVITGKGNFKGTKKVTFKIVAPTVTYSSYVEGTGWQSWVKNGKISGTSGKSKRIEGFKIKATNLPVSGGITYCAHVQGVGWQAWKSNGAAVGLAGKGKRLEAVKIKLTGKLAQLYDVYYRAHCQNVGWTKWVKNGAMGGTSGRSLRVEAIEVKIVPKGTVVK